MLSDLARGDPTRQGEPPAKPSSQALQPGANAHADGEAL
jgi:hypothetical protein